MGLVGLPGVGSASTLVVHNRALDAWLGGSRRSEILKCTKM
jgi:hypothetical protein